MKDKKEFGGLKLVVLIGCYMMLAAFLAMLVVGSNIFPNLMVTDGYCNELIANEVNISYSLGYTRGVYDTSNFVLKEGLLPVFVNESGEIIIQYLNLTTEVK